MTSQGLIEVKYAFILYEFSIIFKTSQPTGLPWVVVVILHKYYSGGIHKGISDMYFGHNSENTFSQMFKNPEAFHG